MPGLCNHISISPEWAIWALSWYAYLSDRWENALTKACQFGEAVFDLFRYRYFIFFDWIPVGFRVNTVQPWATGSAQAEWLYSPEAKRFWEWNNNAYETVSYPESSTVHRLPILSMEITDSENKAHYDLTDFVADIRVQNYSPTELSPSVGHIVGAWSLQSHIIPNLAKFHVKLMDTMGQEHVADLTDPRPLEALLTSRGEALAEEAAEQVDARPTNEERMATAMKGLRQVEAEVRKRNLERATGGVAAESKED